MMCTSSLVSIRVFWEIAVFIWFQTEDHIKASLGADKINAEVYFACAEIDHYAPKEVIDALQAHLQTTHLNYRLEWYPGAEHGFAFPSRGDIYDKPSAERHWVRLLDLFKRNLGPI